MLNTQMNKTLAVDQTEKNSVCNRRKKKISREADLNHRPKDY